MPISAPWPPSGASASAIHATATTVIPSPRSESAKTGMIRRKARSANSAR